MRRIFLYIVQKEQMLFTTLKSLNMLRMYFLRSSYTDSLRSNNNDHQGKQSQPVPATTSLDINKEKRTQKFLLLILISHFLCILPIHVVK